MRLVRLKKNLSDENQKEKQIYVILTKTNTRVAKMIRVFTRAPYSHTSIALRDDLDVMYSFARRKIHNPFNAGFVEEKLNAGILGRDQEVECAIYAIDVDVQEYDIICKYINHFISHKSRYGYNFVGLFSMIFNLPYFPKGKFLCSQYVAWLLKNAGIELFHKNVALVKPDDFRQNLRKQLVYEGKIHDYAALKGLYDSSVSTLVSSNSGII